MEFLCLAAALLTSPAHADATPRAQMACTAVYRTLDDKNNTVERSTDVPVKSTVGDQLKHEADFEGKFFALTEEHNGDLFAQITTAPDYTKGTVVRGAADSLGRFTATEVSGYTVYRLECSRVRN
ncbi:MAG: hypothetical protein ACXVB9_01960 [Bdellovibrionota bacterium]